MKGARLVKPSKGIPVIFWKIDQVESVNQAGEREIEKNFLLRHFTVFNIEQTSIELTEFFVVKQQFSPFDVCQDIINNFLDHRNLKVIVDHNTCYYDPACDTIGMLSPTQFNSNRE